MVIVAFRGNPLADTPNFATFKLLLTKVDDSAFVLSIELGNYKRGVVEAAEPERTRQGRGLASKWT